MTDELHAYYLSKEEPNKSCLLALRSLILSKDSDITETRKWGMPCFCYKKKMFSYLWTDKKTGEPYLLMVEGKHLDFAGLEEGNRSRMKIFRVDTNPRSADNGNRCYSAKRAGFIQNGNCKNQGMKRSQK